MSKIERNIIKQTKILAGLICRRVLEGKDVQSLSDSELEVFREIRRQGSNLARALLLTLTLVFLLRLGDGDLAFITKTTNQLVSFVLAHWGVIAAATALLLALNVRWVVVATIESFYFLCRKKFLPLFAGIIVVWLCATTKIEPQNALLFWAGSLLLFALLVAIFWESKPSANPLPDGFQRGYYADCLIEHFRLPQTKLRRIALLGSWGSGKTTVLSILKAKLERERHCFRTAIVNPWKSKNIEEARQKIASAFDEAFGNQTTFGVNWSKHPVWSWLTGCKATTGVGLTFDLAKFFAGNSTAAEAGLVQKINQRIAQTGKTLVILIDDMERAEPKVIRELFPLIDSLRDIQHCFFVLAIDPDRIAVAFGETELMRDETRGYMDKVFDLQFRLPDPRGTDVAQMCRLDIRADETPKLDSVFNYISAYLPTNPRAAMHFVNDAKTKEIFFLARYDIDEHSYGDFFLFRMLELEAPAITKKITQELANKTQEAIWLADRDVPEEQNGDSDKDRILKDALIKIGVFAENAEAEQLRLISICKALLLSNLDLQWALNDHMRLLTPSLKERKVFAKYWLLHAGEMSLLTMLEQALPTRSFTDNQKAASEFVQAVIDRYTHERRRLVISIRNREKPRSLPEIISTLQDIGSRLISQLKYAFKTKSNFDLNCFRAKIFVNWLQVIKSRDYHVNPNELSEVLKNEDEFSLLVSDLLPIEEKYKFVFLKAAPESNSEAYNKNIEAIKIRMLGAIASRVLDYIRGETMDWRKLYEELDITHIDNPFYDALLTLNYLPSSEWFEPLKALADQLRMGEPAEGFFSTIAEGLLRCIATLSPATSEDLANDIITMIKEQPEYCKLVWETGLHSPHRDSLLELRAKAFSNLGTHSRIEKKELDAAFPVTH